MKQRALTNNTARLIEQLEKAAPGPGTLRLLDAILALVGSSRDEATEFCDCKQGAIIRWAFERGKSPRAAQVRRLALKYINRLADEQIAGALMEERR